LLGWLHL